MQSLDSSHTALPGGDSSLCSQSRSATPEKEGKGQSQSRHLLQGRRKDRRKDIFKGLPEGTDFVWKWAVEVYAHKCWEKVENRVAAIPAVEVSCYHSKRQDTRPVRSLRVCQRK